MNEFDDSQIDQGNAVAQGSTGVNREWVQALKCLKKAADEGDPLAIDYLREKGMDYEAADPAGEFAERPLVKNPQFDVEIILGEWLTTLDDPRMQAISVFLPDGTYHAEGCSEALEGLRWSGRWAVEEDRLLCEVLESDVPLPRFSDEVVLSISQDEWVSRDEEGTVTVYRRKAHAPGQKT